MLFPVIHYLCGMLKLTQYIEMTAVFWRKDCKASKSRILMGRVEAAARKRQPVSLKPYLRNSLHRSPRHGALSFAPVRPITHRLPAAVPPPEEADIYILTS